MTSHGHPTTGKIDLDNLKVPTGPAPSASASGRSWRQRKMLPGYWGECPICRKDVECYIPRGGDGSAVRPYKHGECVGRFDLVERFR